MDAPPGTTVTMVDSATEFSEWLISRGGAILLLMVFLPIVLAVAFLAFQVSTWTIWLLVSIGISLTRLVYSLFVLFHISCDLCALSIMKTTYTIYRYLPRLRKKNRKSSLRSKLNHASCYEDYAKIALEIDRQEGTLTWRDDDRNFPQAEVLSLITKKLEENLAAKDAQRLQYTLLNGLLKRNHLGIDERALHLRALSGTKKSVEAYLNKVVESLQCICDSDSLSREEKLSFLKKARRSLGQTALMLSGGGAIAMYHAGVVRALIKAGLYKYIRVISGTSGGAILAGMLASHTEKELLERVLVPQSAVDFKGDGEQRRQKISWFPPPLEQMQHFIKNGVLVDNNDFQRCCEFYYGDTTFQEAFERTRKHVCISVSASTLGSKIQGPRRLLLNHITTPHVLIRSAVAASCSLPGIMKPNYLLCKDEQGQIQSFTQDGVQYVDGSLQADLPIKRISAMFSVSNFIVSQVNFHVVPFLHKTHSPAEESMYWKIFRFLDMDIRHRASCLSELGLLPRMFGQEIGGVFKQRYFGHITLVPNFRLSEMMGLKAFMSPTEEDMAHYLENGERMLWECLPHILHNTAIERALTDCMAKLRRQTYLTLRVSNSQPRLSHPSSTPHSRNASGNSTTGPWVESEAKTTLHQPLPISHSMARFIEDDQDMLETPPSGKDVAAKGLGGTTVGIKLLSPSLHDLLSENEMLRQDNDRLRQMLAEVLRHDECSYIRDSHLGHEEEEDPDYEMSYKESR